MPTSREVALAALKQNVGFDDPDYWVDYAAAHGFRPMAATLVPNCPDCGHAPAARLGQYVYYSTLIHLMRCGSCNLVWSDAHLAEPDLQTHFEQTYKDRDYFRRARGWIFEHLTRRIASLVPRGGSVLDIGGAQGDLMHLVTTRRPDVTAVVHDVSEGSVRYAREHWALEGICGDVDTLVGHGVRYDVVVLSDVMYYEPHIATLWHALDQLVARGGAIIVRVPNRLLLIRADQVLVRLWHRVMHGSIQDHIRFFNPEHIYIMGRRYLTRRLSSLGFDAVRVEASPPLAPRPSALPLATGLARAVFPVTQALSVLSGHLLTLSSSTLVVATGHGMRRTEAAAR